MIRLVSSVALVLTTFASVVGCDVKFRHSPAEHAAKVSEAGLTGAWRVVTEDLKEMVYLVVRASDDGELSVLYVEAKESGEFDLMRLSAVPFSIGSKRYFSARLIPLPNTKSSEKPIQHLVARYDARQDTITLRTISAERVKTVLDSGKLKGTYEKHTIGGASEITSSAEEVAAFLAAPEADNLFEKEFVLRRLLERK